MANANLLEALRDNEKLDNIIVYGNVRCAIEKPKFLSSKVNLIDGFYAVVDVLAFRCNGADYFSCQDGADSKHIYFSKGNIIVVLDDKSLIGKNVRVFGRYATKGCTLKKQRTSNSNDGVVGFAWAKGPSGNWDIATNKAVLFGESDVKGTVLEEYLVSLVHNQPFNYPSSVDSVMEFQGACDIQPIEIDAVHNSYEYTEETIDLTKVDLGLTYHLEAMEESPYSGAVADEIDLMKSRSKSFMIDTTNTINQHLKDENDSDDETVFDIAYNIAEGFAKGIVPLYNFNIPESKTKASVYIDEFLDGLLSARFRDDNSQSGEDSSDKIKSTKDAIENARKLIQLNPDVLSPDGTDIPVLRNTDKYAALVIGLTTGVGMGSMVSNFNSAYRYNSLSYDQWLWCLIRNPYICGLLGGCLKVADCDKIMCSYTVITSRDQLKECTKYRDILNMMESIRSASSRSTLITRQEIIASLGSFHSGIEDRWLSAYGAPMKEDSICMCKAVLGVDKLKVDATWLRKAPTIRSLEHLLELGLVDEINEGYILTRDMSKEYRVYKELIAKGKERTGITNEQVESTIGKFEDKAGFNLEPLQAEGINLIRFKAAVLSGCAGSGKTTTSDCMVMGIQDYLKGYELYFGAPTGKAARRLAEVVGGNVKTIHSMFGLGIDSEPYIVKNESGFRNNSEGGKKAYFLDEMAMATTDLMYAIVTRLNKDDIIFLFGDIKQLPPIGKGTPFRELMKVLPCVELGVSKRAAANGKINYNVGLINFVSDETVAELQSGPDFEISPCKDADIQKNTVDMFKRYLTEFKEDDIQVVTGYQTDKYPWSTVNLNPMLQKLLRGNSQVIYTYNNSPFYLSDRVIHVKRNAYEIPRFRVQSGNVFEEVVTHGVVNGELGKIVGLVQADDITIIPWQDKDYTDEEWEELDSSLKEIIEARRNGDVEIRDESLIHGEKAYFVVVKVYDVDLKEDVVVFYRATFKDSISNEYYTTNLVGGDLGYLELAYALTTHKMQGSQSEAVIIPLGSTSSPNFMNRNMLNTMITRASKKVGMLGSVNGRDSALTNGRRITTISDGRDVFGLLSQ